jgi:hypothetical protein
MSRKPLLLLGCLLAFIAPALAAELSLSLQPSVPDREAETERAFAQEREADVMVFYDTAKELQLQRPEQKQLFTSETALLAHLSQRKERKQLLVVILSKRHEFSDPNQTLDGFWQACKKAGFERVIIQQAHSSSRPSLRE